MKSNREATKHGFSLQDLKTQLKETREITAIGNLAKNICVEALSSSAEEMHLQHIERITKFENLYINEVVDRKKIENVVHDLKHEIQVGIVWVSNVTFN